jgi:hypothetical protein
LRQGIELGCVVCVVVTVEVEVHDSTGCGHCARTRYTDSAFVRGIHIPIAIVVPKSGFLINGEFPIGRVDVSLDEVATKVGRADDVPVGVLVNVEVAFIFHADHDKLVDVLRAMNELLDHRARAVAGLDDLLAIEQVYHGPVGQVGTAGGARPNVMKRLSSGTLLRT